MTSAQRIYLFQRHRWKCFCCGGDIDPYTGQVAHIVGNTKANRKHFGGDIVDSQLNVLPACGLRCNALIDCGHASNLSDKIAEAIKNDDRELIESLVRENIERKLSKTK